MATVDVPERALQPEGQGAWTLLHQKSNWWTSGALPALDGAPAETSKNKNKVTEGVSFLQKWIHFTLAKTTILTYAIQQRLASFFHRGPNNIFNAVNICSQTQMLCQGNAQAKPDNMQTNVAAPNKTLFTKAIDRPDLHHRATVCWWLLYIIWCKLF